MKQSSDDRDVVRLYQAARCSDIASVKQICVKKEAVGVATSEFVNECRFGLPKWLLASGALLNGKDGRGCTALHLAARRGQLGVVSEILCRSGCLVGEKDQSGCTALHMAAKQGHVDVVKRLVSKGACVDDTNGWGRAALHVAIDGQHISVVEYLVEMGALVDGKDDSGQTPLHLAAGKGLFGVVKLVVNAGAKVNETNQGGATAAHAAAESGHLAVVEWLVRNGARVGMTNDLGQTMLHRALKAADENYTLVRFLVHLGLHPFELDTHGSTSLSYAIAKRKFKIVEYFLKECLNGMMPPAQDLRRAVFDAAKAEQAHILELLLTRFGFDLWRTCGRDGRSALHEAAATGAIKCVKFLLSRGGNEAAVRANYKEYLIDLSDMDMAWAPRGRERSKGSWLGSPVEVKMKYDTNVVEELDRWSKVNHPHVVKLFGVCCEEKVPLFVYERPAHESLLEYRKNSTEKDVLTEMWSKLYEAGLGLEYLHDKGIIHGDIRCDSIAVAKSGAAKWRNLGFEKTTYDDRVPWTAPEVLSGLQPSFEADIFAFGMTVVEAIVNGDPWGSHYTIQSIPNAIQSGKLPDKPLEMTSRQWQLIERMCCYKLEDRPSASDIVRELEVFTREYEMTADNGYALAIPKGNLFQWADLGSVEVENKPIVRRLAKMRMTCEKNPINLEVCHRLANVFKQLKAQNAVPPRDPAQLAVIRQVADNTFAAHGDLDSFMERARLSVFGVHEWRDRWQFLQNKQLQEALLKTPSLDNPNWFIPAWELELDKCDELGSGAYGSAHLGKWKHASVVVKKLKMANGPSLNSGSEDSSSSATHQAASLGNMDLMAFSNEVDIWHRLYHPNVVQMYDACHIGERLFVCEYAGGGQLGTYLRKYPKDVWKKLHEAALGLRYLHVKGIVHGDLKCNNILIGSDNCAKLADFGLSTLETPSQEPVPDSEEQSDDQPKVGAVRWKAPEVLYGEKATFASDIYSFGMCILEAVSGQYPWGIQLPDIAVKRFVLKQHRIPQRPCTCSPEAYHVVERMCRFNASERIEIKDVVVALNELR
ncbi:hypothetical protein PHYPSEUDO_001490 [Phytophthora pseudosyringae]|uniref:Protein kinase domain-containing protein n=1 Tax=Phytophthora pseudosyringae TaxID=221518 RepID=A0A8T1W0I4_9STRA|nr:hypothetical protein PHYPSEUDO_001490 [Phytophthora pseudosyringae]